MSDPQIPQSNPNRKPSPEAEPPKIPSHGGGRQYPNPRETGIPDSATLRDQWRFAIREYSKWYSHAWGTAILAGVSFFALGWFIKGENPLHSFRSDNTAGKSSSPAAAAAEEKPVHQPR